MRSNTIQFGPFSLDPTNLCLWYDSKRITLWAKDFAVLHYLVKHAGQLVTKEELLQAVWPDTYIEEGSLKGCIKRIRQVLGDKAKAPRFIETVHRQGYRFLVPIQEQGLSELQNQPSISRVQEKTPLSSVTFEQQFGTKLIGRETELNKLYQALEKACYGDRQIVFVTGESGIGKTTLINAFLDYIASLKSVYIAQGQCIEYYGSGEAYLPVFEALSGFCRAIGNEQIFSLLHQYAPMWLVQMPWFVTESDVETLQHRIMGATPQRMLREFAELMEVLTRETPLVLVLEDLHWSDYATLDLLAMLARRREPAHLLVLGTYRPTDVLETNHPLQTGIRELLLRGYCQEISLPLLSEQEVEVYLMTQCTKALLPDGLGRWLHQYTGGNPLFLMKMVEYVREEGWLEAKEKVWEELAGKGHNTRNLPETLRQIIELQIERLLPEEQRLLEIGSIIGAEFSAAAIKAGMEADIPQIEACCEGLVRRRCFLRSCGMTEWPDSTASPCYGFSHTLYRQVIYDRVPSGQRQRLHQYIGKRLEAGYTDRVHEIAAELAMHYEYGRDYQRAVHYRQLAAENACRRYAYREASYHLSAGLELLNSLPDTPERIQQELDMQITLGSIYMITKGWSVPEVKQAYTRAWKLCQLLGESPHLFSVLFGLYVFHEYQGDFQQAHTFGQQLFYLAHQQQDPVLLVGAQEALTCTLFHIGAFDQAREHIEQEIILYKPQHHSAHISLYKQDLGTSSRSWMALILWILGYPNQALVWNQQSLTLAQELGHPFSRAEAMHFALYLHQFRQEYPETQAQAEALIAFSRTHDISYAFVQGPLFRGWALAMQGQVEEGITQIQQGLAAYQASGKGMDRPYFLALLAEAYSTSGQIEEGLVTLDEALTMIQHFGDEYFYKAELYRLKGKLLLQANIQYPSSRVPTLSTFWNSDLATEVEVCFQQALDIAHKQRAKLWELRAAISLSRLWQQQGKRYEALELLEKVSSWFTEGLDTKDLREAKTLLCEVA